MTSTTPIPGTYINNPLGIGEGMRALSDEEQARYNAMYNYENPQVSFDNFLRDTGYNPYAANPFVQSLRTLAPSVANSFLMSQALDNSPNSTGNFGLDYRRYMGDIFGGRNSEGQPTNTGSGFYANLGTSSASMPQAIQVARNFNPQQANNVNPWLGALQQRLAAGGGQGSTDMLASFYAPFMGRQMRSAYQDALDMSLANATRNFWNGGQVTSPNVDIYTYLYGI